MAHKDGALISLVARAHSWWSRLKTGKVPSINAIAEDEKLDASDVTRIIPLAFLAPDIVESILDGRQPIDLTAERLKRIGKLPRDWNRKRQILGFTC